MVEAASELMAFWEYHVSEGGRGPHLLLSRLLGEQPISYEENPYPSRASKVGDNP